MCIKIIPPCETDWGWFDLYSLPSHVICRFLIFGFVFFFFLFLPPANCFAGAEMFQFFSALFVFDLSCDEGREMKKGQQKKLNRVDNSRELCCPCLCKKQNDVRVLNDVVCLTICVGIYDEREKKKETREDKFLYII